jgi:hypothetical protein
MLVLMVVVLFVAGQVGAQDVTTDYDSEFDFSAVETVAWGEGGTVPDDELARKRLEKAIEEALSGEGLELTTGGEPDLLLVYHAVVDQKTQKSAVRLGVGVSTRISKRGRVHVGTSTSPKKKTVEIGTLVLELRAAATGDLVWTATATDTLKKDRDARQAQVRKALETAFAAYPPVR